MDILLLEGMQQRMIRLTPGIAGLLCKERLAQKGPALSLEKSHQNKILTG